MKLKTKIELIKCLTEILRYIDSKDIIKMEVIKAMKLVVEEEHA